MAGALIIRAAIAADAPCVARVFQTARTMAMPWLPVLHTPEGDLKFFTRIVSEHPVEVAEVSSEVVGFCSAHDGWIDQLYIHPDHHGQGIGSAFVVRAQNRAEKLQLWVFQQNTIAQAFYTKRGFVEVERTDGSNNEEGCPDIRMTWNRR